METENQKSKQREKEDSHYTHEHRKPQWRGISNKHSQGDFGVVVFSGRSTLRVYISALLIYIIPPATSRPPAPATSHQLHTLHTPRHTRDQPSTASAANCQLPKIPASQ
jgi:hypothetical protein